MKRYAQIAVLALLVGVFAVAGIAKLVSPAIFQAQFAHFGLPDWFVYATGAVELSGAALIASFNETRRRVGSGLVATTMAVGSLLHLQHDPFPLAVPALALMLLAGWTALAPLERFSAKRLAGA